MNCVGWFNFFDFNCVITPFSMDISEHHIDGKLWLFKNYRVFGIRIARWEFLRS